MSQSFTAHDLETFLQTEYAQLRGMCRRIAGSASEGDDLAHSVWILACKAQARYRGEAPPKVFIYQIARRQLKDWRIRVSRKRKVSLDEGPEPVDATDLFEDVYRRDKLGKLHGPLSDDERIILDLLGQGWDVKSIADVFKVGAERMKKRCQRLKQRVRELLEAMSGPGGGHG